MTQNPTPSAWQREAFPSPESQEQLEILGCLKMESALERGLALD